MHRERTAEHYVFLLLHAQSTFFTNTKMEKISQQWRSFHESKSWEKEKNIQQKYNNKAARNWNIKNTHTELKNESQQ